MSATRIRWLSWRTWLGVVLVVPALLLATLLVAVDALAKALGLHSTLRLLAWVAIAAGAVGLAYLLRWMRSPQ